MWVCELWQRPAALAYVIQNMREWDRREIFATRPREDDDELFDAAMGAGPIFWLAGLERPIAAFGCREMWPGVWDMWLFATDEFRHIGISMTRLIKRSIVPALFRDGAHRLECRSMEGHHDAQDWLTVIGARREATLKGYGRDGQDFHVFTWEPR